MTTTTKYETEHGEGIYFDLNGKQLNRSMFNIKWLNDPKCIFDVGAYNFGDSIRFKQTFPQCKVHAFELLPRNYQIYSPYAMSQGVFTYNIAISDKKGLVDYYESFHSNGEDAQSTLLEPGELYNKNYGSYVKHQKVTTQVWSENIDGFCRMRGIHPFSIDLLHCDTEGNEFNVIKGLGQVRPKMIFAEFLLDGGWVGQESFQKTLDLLESLGYDMVLECPFDRLFVYKG